LETGEEMKPLRRIQLTLEVDERGNLTKESVARAKNFGRRLFRLGHGSGKVQMNHNTVVCEIERGFREAAKDKRKQERVDAGWKTIDKIHYHNGAHEFEPYLKKLLRWDPEKRRPSKVEVNYRLRTYGGWCWAHSGRIMINGNNSFDENVHTLAHEMVHLWHRKMRHGAEFNRLADAYYKIMTGHEYGFDHREQREKTVTE
jgi:hypothetical protein